MRLEVSEQVSWEVGSSGSCIACSCSCQLLPK
jgi:hypothetical protein